MQKDISFQETVFVRGYKLQVSGIVYPGERGSDRPGAPGTPDTVDEIELDEIRPTDEVDVDWIYFWHPDVIAEICAALQAKRNKGEY